MALFRQMDPEDRARFAREQAEAVAELRPFQADYAFRTPSGELRWARTSAAPHPLPNGDVLWNGIEVDITATKAADAALREAEERFRTLFEAAPFAVRHPRSRDPAACSPSTTAPAATSATPARNSAG